MAIEYYSSIDLNKNEIQNAVIQPLGSAPGSPAEGQIYYDNTGGDKALHFYNGSAWVRLAGQVAAQTTDTIASGDFISFSDESETGDINNKLTVDNFITTSPKLLTEAAVANGDYIMFLDGGATGDGKKEAVHDLATLFAGSGLTATNSVIAVDTLNQDTSGTAAIATTVTVADESSDTSCNVLFTTAATGNLAPKSGTNLTFNSSSGLLTSTLFAGALTGNVTGDASGSAGTVTTIGNLTGDVTSSNRATTIASAAVHHAMLNDDIISGQGAVTALEQDDLLVVHDTSAGTVNKITYSNLEDDIFGNISGDGTVAAGGALTVTGSAGNFTVTGNLIVSGTTTTINTATLTVEDPLIKLATGNTAADSVDIGFYGLYDHTGSQDVYTGFTRDASDDKWHLWKLNQAEPTTTVNKSGEGYAVDTLVANLEGNVTGDVTGDVTGNTSGTALTVTQAAQSAITSLGTLTTLTVDNVIINGTTIGHTSDTDLMTLTSGTLTVAGLTNTTTLQIGGAAVLAQATASAVGAVELASDAEVKAGSGGSKVVDATQLAAQRSVVCDIDVSSLTDANIVTITHSLGTADIVVQVYDKTTEANIMCDIARTTDDFSTASTSVVSIDFGTAPPNDCRALITSLAGATAGSIAYT